jgi:tRNA(fMet)-specific endonuclease VapC
MTWLLDTNACISFLRRPGTRLRARFEQLGPAELAVCSVVKAELYHGALRCREPQVAWATAQRFLAPLRSYSFDDRAAERYAHLRRALEAQGNVIGAHDLLIAAIALANELTLVSHNLGEFGRVPGLRLEDWEAAE